MNRRPATALALLALLGLSPALALAEVPVRVRVIQGSRQGPAAVDPKLEDLKKQLGKLAYVKWEQVKEARFTMADKKTEFVELPDGNHVGLTVQEVRGGTVTIEVALENPPRNASIASAPCPSAKGSVSTSISGLVSAGIRSSPITAMGRMNRLIRNR